MSCGLFRANKNFGFANRNILALVCKVSQPLVKMLKPGLMAYAHVGANIFAPRKNIRLFMPQSHHTSQCRRHSRGYSRYPKVMITNSLRYYMNAYRNLMSSLGRDFRSFYAIIVDKPTVSNEEQVYWL